MKEYYVEMGKVALNSDYQNARKCPNEVFKSFSALLPAFTILIFWLVVKIGFELTLYQTFVDFINTIFKNNY